VWSDVEVHSLKRLLSFAKGSYQRNLIEGSESVSGSTLKGRAAKYSGRYAASSRALIERLRKADYLVCVERRDRRNILVIRDRYLQVDCGSPEGVSLEVAMEHLFRGIVTLGTMGT
jgi:hypothetical protein